MDGVVEGRDVGAALDGGVPAQRHNTAAGATDVAEHQLQYGRGADHLDAMRVLGPADGVADGGGLVRTGAIQQRLRHLDDQLRGAAGDLGDHIRRVAGEVLLHVLEDAARVFQGRISFGRRRFQVPHQRVVGWSGGNRGSPRSGGIPFLTGLAGFDPLLARLGGGSRAALVADLGSRVLPGLRVVLTDEAVETPLPFLIRTESGEDAERFIFGLVLAMEEVLVDDGGGVGVGGDVLAEERLGVPALGIDDVVDEAAEEGDVAAGPDRGVHIRHRGGASEAWVGVDDLGAFELGLHYPAEGHGVALRHVGALDEDGVRVDEATGEGCRRSAAESHPQTGDAGGVSYTGLVFDGDHPQAAHEFLVDVVPLVVQGGAAK